MIKSILALTASVALAWAPVSKVEMQFKLAKGKVYEQTVISQSIVKQEAMGQTLEFNSTSKSITAFELLEYQTDAGVYNVWYKKMEMELSGMGQSQKYSSDTTALENIDKMSSLLNGIIDKKFKATITKKGNLGEITGLEELIGSAAGKMGESPDITGQIIQSYGNEGLKSSLQGFLEIFPEKAVKKGDSWTISNVLNSGMPVISKTTYTLLSISDTQAELGVEGTLEVDPAKAKSTLNGMDATYFIEGTRKGSISVEVGTGWVTSGNISDEIGGSISLITDPNSTESMVVPMTIMSTTTMSGK